MRGTAQPACLPLCLVCPELLSCAGATALSTRKGRGGRKDDNGVARLASQDSSDEMRVHRHASVTGPAWGAPASIVVHPRRAIRKGPHRPA